MNYQQLWPAPITLLHFIRVCRQSWSVGTSHNSTAEVEGGGGGRGVGRGRELCPKASVVFLLCFVVVFLVVFPFCIRSYYCAAVKAQADKRYMSVMLFPATLCRSWTLKWRRSLLWRSLRTLHLLACHVGVTVRDSGLRCCVCVMSSDRWLTPLCVAWTLKVKMLVEVLLYVHGNRRLIRDGSPGRPPRLSHSARALGSPIAQRKAIYRNIMVSTSWYPS